MMSATAAPTGLVTPDDLERAATALEGVAFRTPLLPVPALEDALGCPAFVKAESLQRAGAFKFRGAYTYLSRMDPEARARGVIAPSSGNHAQAVALAARTFGVPCTVVMPVTVTAPKRAGTERFGAAVELAGHTTADRMTRAIEIAAATGGTVVPPYDDPDIIAGQGTVGLEIAADLPEVRTVLVPVGGGGLSAGVATAIATRCPGARVVGVAPVNAAKLTAARAAGRPVRIAPGESIADGLLAVEIGALPFAHHEAYLADVVTVTDDAIRAAMRFLLDRAKLVVEPSGAVTVAALLERRVPAAGATVAVLSGGNVEWPGLQECLGA